jgi:hypothetical protein
MPGMQEQFPTWPPGMADMPATPGMEEVEPRLEQRPRAQERPPAWSSGRGEGYGYGACAFHGPGWRWRPGR